MMTSYLVLPDIYSKFKKVINTTVGVVLFAIENYRKRFPYILIGEKHVSDSKETILLYRIVGKRHVFEMSAREICNMKSIIGKFHPLDVRIICFIAGVEMVLEVSPAERKKKFLIIKKAIFKS
jgi:hypothetical protein